MIPEEYGALVEDFSAFARAHRWDTHPATEGKCWTIALWFAWYAAQHGHESSVRSLTNPDSTRLQDDSVTFVQVGGWAFDWSSRGHGGEEAPWPIVEPVEAFLERYGPEAGGLCPACGIRDNGRRSARHRARLHAERCPGHARPDQELRRFLVAAAVAETDVKKRDALAVRAVVLTDPDTTFAGEVTASIIGTAHRELVVAQAMRRQETTPPPRARRRRRVSGNPARRAE